MSRRPLPRWWRCWRLRLRRSWRRHRRSLLSLLAASLFFSLLGYCSGPGNNADMCLIYG